MTAVAVQAKTRNDAIDSLIALNHDNSARLSKAVLGCILEQPSLFEQADLNVDHFLPSANQTIWQAMARIREEAENVNIVTVADEVGEKVDPGYLATLLDGCVPENFASYVRGLHRASDERRFLTLVFHG